MWGLWSAYSSPLTRSSFGVEVAFAPLAVGGAGLPGVLVVVQDQGSEQRIALVDVEGPVPAGVLVQPLAFFAGEQVEPGRDGVGVPSDVAQRERAGQLGRTDPLGEGFDEPGEQFLIAAVAEL